MAKFAEAEAEFAKVKICLKCKARNPLGAKKCRKCGYTRFRPKKKDTRKKA